MCLVLERALWWFQILISSSNVRCAMRFTTVLVILAVVVIMWALIPPSPWVQPVATPLDPPHRPSTQIGRVVTAGHGGIVLSDAAGVEHSLPVFDEARVSVNGQIATLEDVQRGMDVRVALRSDGEVMAISTVDIPRPNWDDPHPLWPRGNYWR
jgi:hypothetical protein